MTVIGLDPGPSFSARVVYNGEIVVDEDIISNEDMLTLLLESHASDEVLAIEMVESFGMAVGREVFETVFWSGRFAQAWAPARVDRLSRGVIKQHICHTGRATDANIRTELIDRFGGQAKAIGLRKSPGPLYGIKSHAWAALAVAITWFDLHAHEDPIRPGVNAEWTPKS